MSDFAPLDHPIVFASPHRLTDVDSWHRHVPFAFFAVSALEPRLVVELGTWKGDSYCALCQGVRELGLPARCFAVDTWRGDRHTGAYGPEVLDELRAYHDPRYGEFSTLLVQTFDDAVASFEDRSIDLLHIDGCHTYEAVAHDIETWLPKLSDRAVLLLHDTNVDEPGFGVGHLWNELSSRYPGFAFQHGHGLGVLAVGPVADPAFTAFLRSAGDDETVETFFAALGERIAYPAREGRLREAQERQAHGELERSTAALEEARGDLVHAEQRAEQAEESSGRARAEVEKLQRERARLAALVRERERDISDIVSSPSWRVTAPLRAAKHAAAGPRDVAGRARRKLATGRYEPVQPRPAPTATIAGLGYRPLVSVLTPVYNTSPRWLSKAVESVRGQTYPDWELCLADDGSTNEPTIAYLRSLAGAPRITVDFDENGGIAAATNRALALARGEFVAFLDHDDELDPDALLECVRRLNESPDADVVYTDEDKVDRRGRRSAPFFKPDWSPELFRGVMYVGHVLFVRRSLVEDAGGLDPVFDGVQDYELMLRLSELTARVEHVPRILYHWRKLPGSVAASPDAKKGIPELQAAAVTAHLERCGVPAFARPHDRHPHRTMLHPKPRARWPQVTVIVPTRDAPAELGRCLDSLHSRTTYPSFSVTLVDNGTTDPAARLLFERYPVDVIPYDEPFNFSRANNLGVEQAEGDVVVFLNNDTEIVTPEWLEVLVALACLDGIGAVGPLLVYPNGTVQHAGVVLGLRGTADHIMRGFPSTADGYAGSLCCTREVSAVTGACMLVTRGLFVEAGGFDERFATHYQDVDFCLRLRRDGLRNLYTPRAVVRHDESVTRGNGYDHLDRALLLDAWGETIARGDPYYSPRLSLAGDDYRPVAA